MNENDFNASPENPQGTQGGQTLQNPQGSGNAAPQYTAPQYGQQNQNTSDSSNASWQQTPNAQNPGYLGPDYQYQPPQPTQPIYQPNGTNQQVPNPNYESYGPVPPMGPGPVPPMGPQGYYPPAPNQKWNTLCIIGFVLSFFMPVIGLVLSVVALAQINRTGEKSKGMSVAGIAIGAILTILDIIVVIVLVSAFGYAINHSVSDDESCHGSDCNSDPYDDDGDDPDDDNEDTNYTYYLYDYNQGASTEMNSMTPIA